MSAIKDLFYSEKGLWAYLLPMLGSTVLLIRGQVTPQQWLDTVEVLAGIYVTGKTIQGGAKVFADARSVKAGADQGLATLEERLAANDAAIDELIARMGNASGEDDTEDGGEEDDDA